jgi:hypothetical protein
MQIYSLAWNANSLKVQQWRGKKDDCLVILFTKNSGSIGKIQSTVMSAITYP